MRILHILVLVFLSLSFSFYVKAQADCGYDIKVYVRDDSGKTIKDADVKFSWSEFFTTNIQRLILLGDF